MSDDDKPTTNLHVLEKPASEDHEAIIETLEKRIAIMKAGGGLLPAARRRD